MKNISPRCAIKIDLQKAFNSIHWGFISSILKAINLPPKFTAWIETCFIEARYSISLNGSLVGYFKGEIGLRQGDPLSPILFVLAMNILSKILNTDAARGNLESVIVVTSVLQKFYEISGLQLNVAKSDLFAAGISIRNLESILISTNFKHGLFLVRYLDVPLVTRKLTATDFSSLIEKIRSKIHLWSGKHLIYTGRLELVKTKGTDIAATGARVSWRSLWIAWIYTYVIKSKEFSKMSKNVSYRFCFNRLLKLRSEAIPILNIGVSNSKSIWEELRIKHEKVFWHKLVWFPLHIPKFSIISWLAVLDRLPTIERLIRMGITTVGSCILCNNALETRNHLFADCAMVAALWNEILNLSLLDKPHMSWDSNLAWVSSTWKGNLSLQPS
ncbi:uncharacterized protein LOC120139094 [Hibiscus syriacus]|uniref:uncharacterized protein LOC120139094 n=1 Tax=Hibiscus syriacus TaxID=106335 RepID=UPI0019214B13|nr:uncharacterized protein LOC120139094 [Hibiscus syriacus]